MSEPIEPSVGLGVLHLFCKPTPMFDGEAVVAAVKAAESAGVQVATIATLGHKSDAAFMAMHKDWRQLRALQTGLQRGGLEVVDSYVSLTEVSEYAKGMPQEMLNGRLYPDLPPRQHRVQTLVEEMLRHPLGVLADLGEADVAVDHTQASRL